MKLDIIKNNFYVFIYTLKTISQVSIVLPFGIFKNLAPFKILNICTLQFKITITQRNL